MVTFPTTVSPVRVIGGPRGSAIGPTGPMGLRSSAFVGSTGMVGPTGLQGLMGAAGKPGLASLLMGAMG